jgi:SAM-dependent methyltransferase
LLALAANHANGILKPPRCVRGDMRSLPFASVFGGALLLDSFGFFDQDEENAQALQELRRILLPEGRVVVAVANGAPILADFRPRDVERRDAMVIEIERTLQRNPTRVLEALAVHEPGGVSRYERRQRLYTTRELRAVLDAAAFVVQAMFADYLGRGFDEATSSKVVIVAKAAA